MGTRIIVDAMGGDNAPDSIVRGAVDGARKYGAELVFTGDKNKIDALLSELDVSGLAIETVHTDIQVEMTDSPSVVQKEKRGSSMALACELLRDDKGDAVISSGNTGALFTAATLIVRRHKGIRRSALGAIVNLKNPFMIVDSGANTDVTPEILVQFGLMGSLYFRNVMNVESPRVGLLNNGTEPTKGPQLYKDTYALLEKSSLNFVGNCESRDLASNFCDVVVCDGFTGNITLKAIEGMGRFFAGSLNDMFRTNLSTKLSYLLVKKQLGAFRKSIDHKEYGGAPFLGIAKPVIKSHGSAEPKSIMSTIGQACEYVRSGLNEKIAAGIAAMTESAGTDE